MKLKDLFPRKELIFFQNLNPKIPRIILNLEEIMEFIIVAE